MSDTTVSLTPRTTTFGALPVGASFSARDGGTLWVKTKTRRGRNAERYSEDDNSPEVFDYNKFEDDSVVEVLMNTDAYTTFGALPNGATFYVVDTLLDGTHGDGTYLDYPYTKLPPDPTTGYNVVWFNRKRTLREFFKDTAEVEKA